MRLGIETSTPKKWIIHVARTLQNKLCWTGAWLRGKGYGVNCPGGHPDCTAVMTACQSMSTERSFETN
ncbi:hypothetical protein KP79_PYT13768 [Mizuhopecten yessoensis]|uniref:Uncharacterized protein n=1 Tax=Mizuhopecten yessoensis TaxID=6573 RepID=A0A210R650_MIZYE|nr:hypothetical protein KP79_PYT13768 [Mizuhopecten yessoensis]